MQNYFLYALWSSVGCLCLVWRITVQSKWTLENKSCSGLSTLTPGDAGFPGYSILQSFEELWCLTEVALQVGSAVTRAYQVMKEISRYCSSIPSLLFFFLTRISSSNRTNISSPQPLHSRQQPLRRLPRHSRTAPRPTGLRAGPGLGPQGPELGCSTARTPALIRCLQTRSPG